MFLEFLIAALLGILAGIFTGLTPGIHINLVSLLVVSSSAYLLDFVSLQSLGVFIISMAIAHTFLDVLPAIFLGAPNEATALGVLPGHKLLLQGMGYEAVKLTITGSLFSLILAIFLFPALVIIFPLIYDDIRPYIGFILIAVVIYMILIEKGIDLRSCTAEQVMHPQPATISREALAVDAVELMEQRRITSVLVQGADGKLCGALNSNDLMRAKVI